MPYWNRRGAAAAERRRLRSSRERERERERKGRGGSREGEATKKKLGQVRQVTAPAVLSRGRFYGGTGFEGGRGGGCIGEINTGRVIFFLLLRFETAKCSRDGFCRNEII